jgi:hypothetical protein
MNHRINQLIVPVAAAFALLATSHLASAGQRKFVYSYESTTAPKGVVELENWVTWKTRDTEAGRVDRFDFRHELEIGLTDRLQLGLYLADWRHESTPTGDETSYLHSGASLIYNLTNPTTDFIGSALYFEALVGEDVLELEGKILLEKNFGPVTVAYNAVIEAEWEGDDFDHLNESNGEFKQTAGVAYDITQSFSAGVEAYHEIALPNWEEAEESVVYAGPNVSFRVGKFFATAAGLWQVTDVDGEADFQLRTIFGFLF